MKPREGARRETWPYPSAFASYSLVMVIRSFARFTLPVSCIALASLLSACGSKQEEAKAPSYEVDEEQDSLGGMEMMQEFGGMNEEKVQKTIERLYPSLSDCLMEGYKRVEFLGGEVAFLVKVNMEGRAEAAHAESSTLGDYQAEQCMLDKLRASRWPKPVGGRIGLARTSIAFDPPADIRAPVRWHEDDVHATIESARADLDACGRGGPFTITAYVNTRGKVMSAGVSHSDDSGESTAACLVGAVQSIQFPSPGSWPAKVSFRR